MAARGSGPPCAEVEPSRSPAFPLPISNRADAERELHDDAPEQQNHRHRHRRQRRKSLPQPARYGSVTSRHGTNATINRSSTGTRQNSPNPTYRTEHSNRGRPTRVGPLARTSRPRTISHHRDLIPLMPHDPGSIDSQRLSLRAPRRLDAPAPGAIYHPGITASLAVVWAGPSTGRPSTHSGRWRQVAACTRP